jgi:GT2 family glycosyltransferase
MKKEYCKECGRVVMIKTSSFLDIGMQSQGEEFMLNGEVFYKCRACILKKKV